MSVLSYRCGVLLVIVCVVVAQAQAQKDDFEMMMTQPIKEAKRFYSWEDTKRAASSEEGLRAKRKQFYAWAGKRSAAPVHFFEDLIAQEAVAPTMQKRKQFYAWAGK